MVNLQKLKADIQANLTNERYYLNADLERLAYNEALPYKVRVENFTETLKKIANVEVTLGLLEKVFQQPQQQQSEQKKEEMQVTPGEIKE